MDYKELAEKIMERQEGSFNDHCRTVVEAVEKGGCRVSFEVEPIHLNPSGTVHGGMLFSLADTAAGIAAHAAKDFQYMLVTQNASIYYLRPGKGKKMIAEAKMMRTGITTGLVHVDITNESGLLIAHSDIVVYYTGAVKEKES